MILKSCERQHQTIYPLYCTLPQSKRRTCLPNISLYHPTTGIIDTCCWITISYTNLIKYVCFVQAIEIHQFDCSVLPQKAFSPDILFNQLIYQTIDNIDDHKVDFHTFSVFLKVLIDTYIAHQHITLQTYGLYGYRRWKRHSYSKVTHYVYCIVFNDKIRSHPLWFGEQITPAINTSSSMTIGTIPVCLSINNSNNVGECKNLNRILNIPAASQSS